jgi:signal peptidase I
VLRAADEGPRIVKRVVALPGDRLRIDSGVLFINDTAVAEPYAWYISAAARDRDSLPVRMGAGDKDIIIPADMFFVLGDNRSASMDSRVWGPVARSDVLGFVVCRLW